jgi:hypothetical protein
MKSKPVKAKSKDSFEAVAKRLECDPDMAAFDKKLGKIAKAKTKQTARK